MQRKHVSIVTVLLAVAILTTGAVAQDRGTTDRRSNPSTTDPSNMSRTSSLTGSHLVRADDLIGTELVDLQGDKVGAVDDLLLDAQGNSVTHVVVARGGFLGMGVKRHAVPWQELQLTELAAGRTGSVTDMNYADREIQINADKDEFAQANPPLDADAWDEYEPDDMGRASRRVTDILGSDVNGRNQDAIGEIQDLVIDTDQGRIAYALVDYDGAWSLDSDQLSVPWPSVNRSGGVISTTLDESSARQLGFRSDDFSRLGERDQRDRLYGATGSAGYWDDDDNLTGGDTSWDRDRGTANDDLARRGDANRGDMTGSTGSSGRSGSDTRYSSATDDSLGNRAGTAGRSGSDTRQGSSTSDAMKGEQVTVSGTIESIMPAGTAGSPTDAGKIDAHQGTASAGMLTFRLKQEAGGTVTVDAGSKAALDRQSVTLKQGDRVSVTGHRLAAGSTGSSTTGAAGDVIMARTLQKDGKTVQVERTGMHDKSSSTPHNEKH
jgi:sporulation protein YlmC with PRC-barrel domain